MEFSGVAPPDTSDITSNTKFTAHFNRPSAQRQSHTQNTGHYQFQTKPLCRNRGLRRNLVKNSSGI